MLVYKIKERNSLLIDKLVEIWENSVRVTHLFLTEVEVLRIKEYVPQALLDVPILLVAENTTGKIIAFMEVADKKIEMLFVEPAERLKGVGRMLIEYGSSLYKINEVTVNEQNTQAIGFYKHLGFSTYKRTDMDEEGKPYPLLYMRIEKS
ncbi:MAG: GNAT family N-acetyltransferase [Phascolarctobacterium sp.]|nr:GNAT family N-acetyltransferase [Phascolarctobacterium sp.]